MPHTQLTKQGRMHEYIAAIPSKYVYENKLETAESRKGILEHDIASRDVVAKLRKLYTSVGALNANVRAEKMLRLQGFEIDGSVVINDRTGSRVNPEQTNFVLEKILPAMQDVYGAETSAKCKGIVGYSEGVDRIRSSAEAQKLHVAQIRLFRHVVYSLAAYARDISIFTSLLVRLLDNVPGT